MFDGEKKQDGDCGCGEMPPCSTVLDMLPAGLLMVDCRGRIRTWNRMMETLTGYRAGDALGQSCAILECGSDPGAESAPEHGRLVDQALREECGDGEARGGGVECQIRTKKGDLIPVLRDSRTLRAADGSVTGVMAIFSDLRPTKQLERELADLRDTRVQAKRVGRLVGDSPPMREVYRRILLAAESEATVLLLGETGTGKELVAEAIHAESARSQGAFIKINCSALPETLLESELFGHVKGAFTGAAQDKMGRFEAAHGGTLLLDEIGDLSPLIQLKLLRVLQEHEFERVGDTLSRKADVRVICATHRDLREMVGQGSFREDLFYRIRVFPVELPALRQRKSDIPLLIEAFIERLNSRTGKSLTGLTDDAMHCMMDYCWPGNVRELENAIEHAFVTCREGMIDLFDLPAEIRMVELRTAYCRDDKLTASSAGTRSSTLVADTPEALRSMLETCNWNQSEAARRLGVDRTTIWRKTKRWGLTPPS